MTQGRLDGKVIVFTGSATGIGRSVVTRFVAEGARVVAADVSPAVNTLRDELGDAVMPIVGDASTWEGNVASVQLALDTWGHLDVFVANAGLTDGAVPLERIAGDKLGAAFDELFHVNVLAPMLGARSAFDALVESRGTLILTGSFASSNAAGGGSLYTASKHAVLGLVRQLAYEFAPDIRVNGVAPGVAPTRLRGLKALGQEATDSVLDGTRNVLPLQEIGGVDAYDGVFTLLASDDSLVMTGTMVTADSGLGIRGIARPGGRVAANT